MSGARTVDGNTLGGLLAEVFAVDLTTATTTCAHCGHAAPLATLEVYLDAPGAVARCRGCKAVQLRLVSDATRWWLDLQGVRVLEIPRPPEAPAP